jgi:hypothetical protein
MKQKIIKRQKIENGSNRKKKSITPTEKIFKWIKISTWTEKKREEKRRNMTTGWWWSILWVGTGKEKLVVVPIIPAFASWWSSDLLISFLHIEVKFKALRWCDVTPGGVQSASFLIFCFSRYADNEKWNNLSGQNEQRRRQDQIGNNRMLEFRRRDFIYSKKIRNLHCLASGRSGAAHVVGLITAMW